MVKKIIISGLAIATLTTLLNGSCILSPENKDCDNFRYNIKQEGMLLFDKLAEKRIKEIIERNKLNNLDEEKIVKEYSKKITKKFKSGKFSYEDLKGYYTVILIELNEKKGKEIEIRKMIEKRIKEIKGNING
jgi:hypothetical protein